MLKFIVRRMLLMIPTLIAVSILSFLIIQAPAGDFVDTYVAGLRQFGQIVEQGQIDALRDRYGLNQPVHVQLHLPEGERVARRLHGEGLHLVAQSLDALLQPHHG